MPTGNHSEYATMAEIKEINNKHLNGEYVLEWPSMPYNGNRVCLKCKNMKDIYNENCKNCDVPNYMKCLSLLKGIVYSSSFTVLSSLMISVSTTYLYNYYPLFFYRLLFLSIIVIQN